METKTEGIREQSAKYSRVQNLMHNVNEETLMTEHRKQSRRKAVGVDGVSKEQYDEKAESNIRELVQRMRKYQYKPKPVKRVYIPKANGKQRPLGLPSYEDKLVQGVMANILNDVYEPRFLDCSYGFRENRSAHDVVRLINQTIMRKKVNYVLEADIKGFFDNVDHDWLMKFLEHDIDDKNFLRYIKRFLISGIMEGTERKDSDRGTPQGGLISPVLANVYLHYVLDLWFERGIKPRLKGKAYYVRYADDFLILFQYENEAQRVMQALKTRLEKFGLEVAKEKTRILPIGRFKGTKEDFDFLGFTFYNATTRTGKYRLGVRTSKKKLKEKKQAAKAWLKTRLTKPLAETMKILVAVIRGHCNYYGVNGNFHSIQNFWKYLRYSTYRMLNRRDQKGKFRVRKVSESVELLCIRTSFNDRYMGLVSNDCLKSRMRENRTYGSVRGSRQAFHLKYFERNVEIVYSTVYIMKESAFNLCDKYDDASVWVYNTLTTATVILENDIYKNIFENRNWSDFKEEFESLCSMGYFIDDDFDELDYLSELRKTVVRSNSKISDIMIAPTMDCNARCYYCFEHGSHHDKMTYEIADAVVKYIEEHWNHELFNINWFGGEPLMATDVIEYITEKMELAGIQFISRITTNGLYLTRAVAKRAKEKWHTTKIQISIDALFEEYDRIKHYVDTPTGAFDVVILNLKNALEEGLKVRVRINFNPLEKEKATKLMSFLQSKFSEYSNFSSYFAPIDANSDIVPSIAGKFSKSAVHPYFSLIQFAQKYGYFSGNTRGKDGNFLFDDKGLLQDLKLYPSPTNCYASCPCVFAIDSHGDLYKCHRVLGKGKKYASGNVVTGIEKNEIYNFFCNSDLAFEECKTCKILPICQGGCKINAYIYHDEHACTPIKSVVNQLVRMYIDKSIESVD